MTATHSFGSAWFGGSRSSLGVGRRSVLAVVAASSLVLGVLGGLDGLGDTAATAAAAHDSTATQTYADLPMSAQGAISERVGRDSSAYSAFAQEQGFGLSNPHHAIDASFTAGGLNLTAGADHLQMALRAAGYGTALAPVAAAMPRANANRIEYVRGSLTEWYVNGPLGVEQGFTFGAAPAGATAGPLTLDLSVAGSFRPVLDSGGTGITLQGASGSIFYRGLSVTDANGKSLPAWFELAGSGVLLRFDDAGAAYPITIDPVFQAKLVGSDGAASDDNAWSVAVSGDVVVTGAPLDDFGVGTDKGSAYVFVKPGLGWTGTINQVARLAASDNAAGDRFGYSVAISGDVVAIGAPLDDTAVGADAGSVYIFVKPAGGWTGTLFQNAKLTSSDEGVGDQLGFSVAISGDTVAAGARLDDFPGATDQGSAAVFLKPGGGWTGSITQTSKLFAGDGLASDFLGWGVGVSGNVVVVAAPGDDIGANLNQGSAYVYVKGVGPWTALKSHNAKLVASDGAAADLLGGTSITGSVGISGDVVVAGASFDDIGANADQGSAYVFIKPGANWAGTVNQTAKLTASDGVASDFFGFSVAISGDTIIAGAVLDDSPIADAGSAYLFYKPTAGWANATENAKLTASDAAATDELGFSVAIDGAIVVAGAVLDDAPAVDQGTAYVVAIPATAPTPTVTKSPSTPTVNEPSGSVTYTVTVTNPASATESVTITALTDSVFGNLNGQGTCATGTTLAPGATYTCTFTKTISGNAGFVHTNTATATVRSSFGRTASGSGSATVTVADVPPATPTVTKTSSVPTVPESGGSVTYTVKVTNPASAVEPVTITALTDSQFGNLAGQGTCATGTSLAPGATYTCTFTKTISGDSGGVHTNTVTASVKDDEGGSASGSGSASVTFTNVPPSTPTVTKTPGSPTVAEPGGSVTYTVKVTNPASAYESVTVSSLTDSAFGNLNGQGTCATGTALAPGATYTCTFSGTVSGNAGFVHTNTVTAVVTDNEGSTASGMGSATVTVTDVPPATPIVSKTPDTPTVPEPGGSVTYTISVTNPASAVESVTITALTDSAFGNLAGQGTCATGTTLAPGQNYSCSFMRTVSGNAGFVHNNTASATVKDDENNSAIGSGSASVTVTDVPPATPTVTKTPSSPTVDEPGGSVTYTVTVTNPASAVESVTITSLSDSQFGNLAGQGTCATGTSLAPGATYTCAFAGTVSGNAGFVHTNTVTATVKDDEGGSASGTASATVTVADVPPATPTVTKTPSSPTVPEPGGSIIYTVKVTNPTSAVESVTVTALSDSQFGDLNGQGTCATGASLSPGQTYTCAFPGTVSGNAGFVHTNTVTATVKDDEGGSATGSGSATVTVTDVLPQSPAVTKTPSSPTVPEPGAPVTFTVTVTNPASAVEPVTITALTDNQFGNLNGQGTCATGATLAPGATYTCAFTGTVSGNAGSTHADTVTATVKDDENNPATGTASATVTVTDVLPQSPAVTKTPNSTTVPEPGASVTYTVTVTNPASAVESVTVTSLTDSLYGNLAGQGTCNTGATLAPGATYTCSFTKTVSGNAGATHTNTVTATVKDDENNPASGTATATVTVTDVLPSIAVDKTANPSVVPAPGGPGPGTVTYTVTLKNNSVEPVTVTSLVDDTYGNLNGQGTCATGAVLAPGATYTCSFTGVVSGPAGTTHTNTVTGQAKDDENNTATDTGSATVTIVVPTAKVSPQFTTCQNFRDGTAQDLSQVTYTVQNGKISAVSSQLFYYTKITAPSAAFTINVIQSRDNLGFKLFSIQPAQTTFFNANCQKSSKGTVSYPATDGSNVKVAVTGALPNEVFYFGVMYNPFSVVGTAVSQPYPTVNYAYETRINNVAVLSSREGVVLKPQ